MAGWGTLAAAPVALGVGEAAGAAIEPVLEPLKQDAWAKQTPRVLDVRVLASLVAQGLITLDEAHAEAKRSGFDSSRLDRLVQLELVAAPVAELLELWRREKISEKLVDHGLAKAHIEPQYWDALKELYQGRLDPEVVSLAIQRRVMNDPGYLISPPPISDSNVPLMPVSKLDAVLEAQANGIDPERLAIETRLRGIPPAPGELMQLLNRGIINGDAFNLGVVEGDTRQEWAPFLRQLRFRVLSGVEAAELHVRNWIDRQTMYDLGSLDGWTQERMDLLYDLRGRPLSLHQAFIGERRGGVYKGDTAGIPQWALDEMGQSNVRPEWFNLSWAQRHTLPSAFVIRALLQGGAISTARGEELFLWSGWPEDLAHEVAVHYGGSTATAADSHVTKAQTQLWGTVHRSYLSGEIDAAQATAALPHAGVAAANVDDVLAVWNVEKALPRKTLSAANIRKAYNDAAPNDATGSAWTRDEAVAALIALGYSTENANSYLDM